MPDRCDEFEWRAQFRLFCEAIEKVEDLKKVSEGELTSMEVLRMLLATQNELYKGCEAVIDILIQAALSISVESIVESWISVIEHHSSKSRPLGEGRCFRS